MPDLRYKGNKKVGNIILTKALLILYSYLTEVCVLYLFDIQHLTKKLQKY